MLKVKLESPADSRIAQGVEPKASNKIAPKASNHKDTPAGSVRES